MCVCVCVCELLCFVIQRLLSVPSKMFLKSDICFNLMHY